MHIVDAENRSTTIKNVGPGENVSSLLSFVDVATGHPNVYRTVCCRAVADSVIVKLPSLAFRELFEQSPDTMIRVVQGGNSIDFKISIKSTKNEMDMISFSLNAANYRL